MDPSTMLDRLESEVTAFVAEATADDFDPSLAVPTCPGWDVAALFGHLGAIHRWVRRILATGKPQSEPEPPTDPGKAVRSMIYGASTYLKAMRAIRADRPCWNFGPRPRLAGFWIRRQLHEHLVHRYDLALATGIVPAPLDATTAADGIDEVVTVFAPRQIRLGRTALLGGTVQLQAVDADRSWSIGEGGPTATISAPAEDLYFGLWHRRSLAEVAELGGNRGLLDRALASALAP